jgi:hypothetical protein
MTSNKAQGLMEWHRPSITALYFPANGIQSTEDRFNWMQAVQRDGRLTPQQQLVLIRLVQFYNLKTRRCDPTMRHLAMMAGIGDDESAEVMARAAVRKGEKLSWVRRHRRSGGRGLYNQSNTYEFMVPAIATPAGLAAAVDLKVVEKDGRWYVAQVQGGVKICGRFNSRKAAEAWAKEHGPESLTEQLGGLTEQSEGLTEQFEGLDRTGEFAYNSEALNTEHENTELKSQISSLSRGGSNEPYHPGYPKSPGRQTDTLQAARNNNSYPAPAADSKVDIEALARKVCGGTSALMHLRLTGKPKTVGALAHSVRLGNEELDVAAFLTCGAVYREGDLIYPVGYVRRPDGSFFDPGEYPF